MAQCHLAVSLHAPGLMLLRGAYKYILRAILVRNGLLV